MTINTPEEDFHVETLVNYYHVWLFSSPLLLNLTTVTCVLFQFTTLTLCLKLLKNCNYNLGGNTFPSKCNWEWSLVVWETGLPGDTSKIVQSNDFNYLFVGQDKCLHCSTEEDSIDEVSKPVNISSLLWTVKHYFVLWLIVVSCSLGWSLWWKTII